jgi:16S rRNA (guanine(966)-N(2))-methyltransferase RsmD
LSVRIIAGSLKGRRILVPPGSVIRPTPERVREALFSILAAQLPGARVLDAFCGSGILGLEALSRGAGRVVFADSDGAALGALRGTAQRLQLTDRAGWAPGAIPASLQGLEPFDLIFADPPYRADAGPFLRAISNGNVLKTDGDLVLERDARRAPPDTDGLALTRTERYGSTCLHFYRCPARSSD